ncbi:hypothetical protein Barb7_02902 [Bacteroidales bacterium Barb7]|nr:hypothetical protein Barb7_02902 [Bacteroidales bacterium Barb7]
MLLVHDWVSVSACAVVRHSSNSVLKPREYSNARLALSYTYI